MSSKTKAKASRHCDKVAKITYAKTSSKKAAKAGGRGPRHCHAEKAEEPPTAPLPDISFEIRDEQQELEMIKRRLNLDSWLQEQFPSTSAETTAQTTAEPAACSPVEDSTQMPDAESEMKEPTNTAQDICRMFSRSTNPKASLKELVISEMERPEGALDQMMRRSKMVAAFGRRLFDETEIMESSGDEDDDQSADAGNPQQKEKKKAKKKAKDKGADVKYRNVKSRFMQMYETKDEMNEEELNAHMAAAMIEQNPVNFGLWDKVLDPVSAKSRLEKMQKRSSDTQQMEEEIRLLSAGKGKRVDGAEEGQSESEEEGEEEDPGRVNAPLRNIVATGKYLHENDMNWCKKNTRFVEKDIIKWFKRFRALCPRGRMSSQHLEAVYERLFEAGGKADVFSATIMRFFDTDNQLLLDFKVFLFIVQFAVCKTTQERLELVFQIFDLDNHGSVNVVEMENMVIFYEQVDRQTRSDDLFDQPPDSDTVARQRAHGRTLDERLDRVMQFLDLKVKQAILKDDFLSIPGRCISMSGF